MKNSDFAANFMVDYGDRANQTKATSLGETAPAGAHFGNDAAETTGMTAVGIVVWFNDVVEELAGTDPADDTTNGDMLANALRPTGSTVAGTVSFEAPDNVVHISYTSSDLKMLPARAGFRVIPAEVATSYGTYTPEGGSETDIKTVRKILNSLRPDSRIMP